MKKQFIHKACWGGNKGSFWVLNLGYMFHIALRLLFISLQTPQELFQTELSALFVPVSDLQRAHGWEQVPSGEVAVAFPLQSCFWTSEQESTLPALCSSTLCSPQFWQVAHEGAPEVLGEEMVFGSGPNTGLSLQTHFVFTLLALRFSFWRRVTWTT